MSEYNKSNGDFVDNYLDDKPIDYRNVDPNIKDEIIETPNVDPDTGYNIEEEQDNQGDQDIEEDENDRRGQKKYNVQEAIQAAQRDKYNAIAENERLKQEVNRLKNVSEQTSEAALRHYEENINNRLRQARAMLSVAKERGDVDAEGFATEELTDARAAVNELSRWKADNQSNNTDYEEPYKQNQYQPDPYQGYQQPTQIHSTREMAAQAAANGHNWAAHNTWFNEESPDYDPKLSAIAIDISYKMEQEAIRRGHGDAIGSPRYLQELDHHLSQVRNQGNRGSNNVQVQNRGLNMKQSRSPVSSVRNSGSNSYNYNNRSKSKSTLSPAHAEFARINKFNSESFAKRVRDYEIKKQTKK